MDEPTIPSNAEELVQRLTITAESKRLEFKRTSNKMVSKALETISAFANAEGGVLVLGLADLKEHQGNARFFGVEENAEAVDELRRKLRSEIQPVLQVRFYRLPCKLGNGPHVGNRGHLLWIQVPKSGEVHSLVNSGTFTRLDAGNRHMDATEINELSYRRGKLSATSAPVNTDLTLLQSSAWARYASARGPLTGTFEDQLLRLGLAVRVDDKVQPRMAAVLLFADEPGSLLAVQGHRADIRLLVYDGKEIIPGARPNLRKPQKSIRGPLIDQIQLAVKYVLDELSQGLTLSGSGFQTVHSYPERVVKEAIVNAVLHRDYRLNRDIFIRIFDDRIEVESPGVLPGNITPKNIDRMGSHARNQLLALHLREFPTPPNLDAGEGVRMMFAEMSQANLYPPQYRENMDAAIETVTVLLLNHQRPTAWDEVSDWLDRNDSIANQDVCRIAKLDTLKASKMLIAWRDKGLLVQVPGRGRRNMAYMKPSGENFNPSLLSSLEDNNENEDENS